MKISKGKEENQIKLNEIGEFSVYSNQKKKLQYLVRHEVKEIGFIYDTQEHYIIVLNLRDMMPFEKCPIINSGKITNMFIDKDHHILYYQRGTFYDKI